MARLDVKTQDPERYAQVKAEQEELKLQFSMAAFGTSVARLCPYCEHKIEILYRGEHGPSRAKCPNCGEALRLRHTGSDPSRAFYGCTGFPNCRYTRPCK